MVHRNLQPTAQSGMSAIPPDYKGNCYRTCLACYYITTRSRRLKAGLLPRFPAFVLYLQLLATAVREAGAVEALRRDRRRQAAELQAAFGVWLLDQQRVALSQPLPRGWVPHPHPDTGRMCYLNTRTGESRRTATGVGAAPIATDFAPSPTCQS